MSDQDFVVQFLNGLFEKTRAGKLRWESGSLPSNYRAILPDESSILFVDRSTARSDNQLYFRLLDQEGSKILEWNSSDSFVEPLLRNLYGLIRQQVPDQTDLKKQSALEALRRL